MTALDGKKRLATVAAAVAIGLIAVPEARGADPSSAPSKVVPTRTVLGS